MSSLPSVTINSGTPNISSFYPSLMYPSTQVISATALTPSSLIPYTTIPAMTTVAPLINIGQQLPFHPLYPSVITYPDVNANADLRQKVTEYFFDKILKNWLKYHYLNLFSLVSVSNGIASLIKDIKQAETNLKNDSTENAIKYEFIVDNFLTKKDVYTLLEKFRKKYQLNWWDLKQHADDIRKFIGHKVRKYIKTKIIIGK